MTSESILTCAICDQPIARNERWEYWRVGSNDVGTPIHSACKATLVQQVMQDIHAKPAPTDRRDDRSE